MKLNNGEKPQSAKVAGAQSVQLAQERGGEMGGRRIVKEGYL